MIQLPQYKVFLIKFSSSIHRDLVSRMISRVNGQVAAVADQEELTGKLLQYQPEEIAGLIYELGDGTKSSHLYLSDVEQENTLRKLRNFVGADIPIVAIYYPSSEQDYDLTATENRLGGYGADAVLPRPFGFTEFYSALEKALKKYK